MDLKRMKQTAEKIIENPTLFTDAVAILDVLIDKEALIEKLDAKKRELDSNQEEMDRVLKRISEIRKVMGVKTEQVNSLDRQLQSEMVVKYESMEKEEVIKIEEKMKDALRELKNVNIKVTQAGEVLAGLENKIESAHKAIRDIQEKTLV